MVVGGAINWFITTRSKDAEVNKARGEKGTLIASGFIAGGALMGVVSALLKFGGIEPVHCRPVVGQSLVGDDLTFGLCLLDRLLYQSYARQIADGLLHFSNEAMTGFMNRDNSLGRALA